MKLEPSGRYEKIEQTRLCEGTAVAWISREMEDADWDRFLQGTSLGQFQQSAIWAQAKRAEGWKPVRVAITIDQELVGGFQMLGRSSWWGRIGYVSKGPVVLPGILGLPEFATHLLLRLTRSEKLRGLMVQPPDLCRQMTANLAMNGFDFNTLIGVIDATWIVGLGDEFEATEQRMSKWTRKKIRQALNRGIRIREGERSDVKTFFELMLATCRRQRVAPFPADERTILALWDAALPTRCIRLTFAEHEGKPLAGLLSILFGQTASLWKKGWTSTDGQLHPNEPLMQEMLKWSKSRGYRFADFCALDKGIAIAMLTGESLSLEQQSSRHMFNVRLGGRPRLLPESRVYFPNPGIRFAYRMICWKRIRQARKLADLVHIQNEHSRLNSGAQRS